MNQNQWNNHLNDLWGRVGTGKVQWMEMESNMRDALKHYDCELINATDLARIMDDLLAIYTKRGNVLPFITG